MNDFYYYQMTGCQDACLEQLAIQPQFLNDLSHEQTPGAPFTNMD